MNSVGERMTQNFRVLDAAWPRASSIALVGTFAAPRVVVRWQPPGQSVVRYYVFGKDDLAPLLEKSAADLTGDALALERAAVAPTVPSTADPPPSPEAHVVVDSRGRIVGLWVPPRTVRAGFVSPGVLTGDAPSPVPLLTRQLSGTLPSSVEQGSTVSLLVALDAMPASGAQGAPLAKPSGTKIDVVVKALDGLVLEGKGEGTLVVQDPQPDLPLQFKVRAERAGAGSVRIYAFCDGAPIASLSVATKIVPTHTTTARGDSRGVVEIAPVRRTPPDLSLFIFEEDNELSFRLQSADGRYHMSKFGPVSIKANPRDYFRDFFHDIEKLRLDNAKDREIAAFRLEQKGASLFATVIPEELRTVLWELRDQIKTVQITSDEPWIPWEVCRLSGKVNGRVVGGPFFAEAFCVTRWLYGVSTAPRLRVGKIALVVPNDSGLPMAQDERRWVSQLKAKVTDVPATLLDVTSAMSNGDYDAWHFTGHGRADDASDADRCAIELQNREVLTPADVEGLVSNVLLVRPFVFFNACQSAQGGMSLTGVGGWAQRFLRPNSKDFAASAFVGSYWSVVDDTAFLFCKALYTRLFQGAEIGRAVKEARAEIRESAPGDPSWLAYTVYADPNATLEAPA